MNFNLIFFILLTSFGIVYFVFKFLKKHSLHPQYAVLWTAVGVFLLSIIVLEDAYAWVSKNVFGLTGGDHFIYISLISFLLVYCFYLTSRMCLMSDRVSKLISFTAVLENEVSKLKENKLTGSGHDQKIS